VTSAELAVIAALGASALTGLASLGVVAFQEWRRDKAANQAALRAAIAELLARSLAFTLRAQTLASTGRNRSGPTEVLDVLMYHRKPIDFPEMHDWMAQDWTPLNVALSAIWIRWDQEGVRLANDLVGKCADLFEVSLADQPARKGWERLRWWSAGRRWTPEWLADYQHAVRELDESRKRLADYARGKLGQESVDLPLARVSLDRAVRQPRAVTQ
jgi:hypothetical protein